MEQSTSQIQSFLITIHSRPGEAAQQTSLQTSLSFLNTFHLSPTSNTSHTSLDTSPYSLLLHPSNVGKEKLQEQNAIEWLRSALAPSSLFEQALEILKSPSSDEDVVPSLIELWGYEGIEKVGMAVQKRSAIVELSNLSARGGGDLKSAKEKGGSNEASTNARSSLTASPHFSNSHQQQQQQPHIRTPQAQITFQTQADLLAAKKARKANKHYHRAGGIRDGEELNLEEWERIREESLARGPGELVSGNRPRIEEAIKYPHVYLSPAATAAGNLNFGGGQRMAMPLGTTRLDKGEYEEIIIPAPEAVPFRFDEALLPISGMDPWGQRTFHAYKTLNRLQSIVFPVAYNTNENMLVCAPTGAGKTDVALLAILRCLSSLCITPLTKSGTPTLPPASTYKIIYVAPLKALAAEITLKFSKRLGWAGVKVRELTGDMKMTKKEVEETGVIVTTPEKWDVVTRKGAGAGDGEVAEKVKLLIIDEVHLLHEDRGAVIESIVARTLRQVESSQNLIRIVGLSATLPNYVDVADFLRVNRYQGLFYFDSSFRPVPLEQHFIGVKGKPGSIASRTGLDNAAFDKVAELVKQGHQVMVFVHARKDTVKTAQMLHEKSREEGISDLLDPVDHEKWAGFKRDMGSSRNREMKDLAALGFGIHHAGMLRSDRNITERMFEQNVTKVLCCTATLAWGVNLPAYAVVIKGTQIYDSGKGAFVDLSILDVLQIFGRAGRPQYESQGVGYICTTSDKIDHYVAAITQQHPIESKFIEGLVDSLNAEISLGTVTNMDEGVRWLGYSYLFVRMRKNPLVYGMVATDVEDDPLLGSKRHSLITLSAKRLVETQMIKFDPDLGTLVPTDLGRIASRYYIRNASIEIFNKMFRPRMSEADVLALISSSVEFNQISVRENEVEELTKLIETVAPCQVKGGTDTSAGKVNVLLQSYISKAYVDDFALVSDTGYVSQNAGRIVRALLEIAMSKRWAPVSLVLMAMSKAIEKRLWPFSNPLGQFNLPSDLLYNIERWADDLSVNEVALMSDAEFGALIHQNERLGGYATSAARQMPSLKVSHTLQPLSHDLLKIRLKLRRQFEWSEKQHGTAEAFWVWVEDEEGLTILQLTRILVRSNSTVIDHIFVVPLSTIPAALHIRVVSDRWMGAEDAHLISLHNLVMPRPPYAHLPLLELPLLSPHDALSDSDLSNFYASENQVFDPVQTQAFHTLYHTSNNTLICAPSAASRGTLLELAIWRAFSKNPKARVLFIAPRKALARHVYVRLRNVFSPVNQAPILLLSRNQEVTTLPAKSSFIAVATPTPTLLRQLLANPKFFGDLDLIIAHDLQALDSPYELLTSRLRWSNPQARIVGSSSSVLDATDLASWLGVPGHSTYSFSPAARSSSLNNSFQPFSTPHSAYLLRSMVKPAYAAMRLATGSTICFVPSRAQCRATAKDLVTQTAADPDDSFVAGSRATIELYAQSIQDAEVAEALAHGIAVFHEGLRPEEQALALELFESGTVRVLIASREACWTLSVRASLVIIMSCQFAVVKGEEQNGEREIQDYPLPEILQMQSLAVPPRSDTSAECVILCQKDQGELYLRFLDQGVMVESDLLDHSLSVASSPITSLIYTDMLAGRIRDRQDVVEALSYTYLSKRLVSNPSYYASKISDEEEVLDEDGVARLADAILDELEKRCCVLSTGRLDVALSSLGKVGIDLAKLSKVQKLPLDEMIQLTKPIDKKVETDLVVEKQEEIVTNFFNRLPRSIRDLIGAEDKHTVEQYRRRILLGAFSMGRIPRGEGGIKLEAEQLALVRRLLKSTN